MKKKRLMDRSSEDQVPKRSYELTSFHGPNEESLLLSHELDIDISNEFQGLRIENEDAVSSEEEGMESGQDPFGKTIAPVQIYLREMGSFPLLTREGEVEIAKRIESGQQEVLSVVLHCPIAIKEIIKLGDLLREGKLKIKEVTHEIDDEESSVEEERNQKNKGNETDKYSKNCFAPLPESGECVFETGVKKCNHDHKKRNEHIKVSIAKFTG